MVVSGHTGSVVKFIVLISIVLQKYESTFGLSSQKGSLVLLLEKTGSSKIFALDDLPDLTSLERP